MPSREYSRSHLTLVATLVVTLCAGLAHAAPRQLAGRAHVLDGDTITVGGVTVRLQGVAAPELEHAGLGIEQERGGAEAAAFLRQLVEGRTVLCGLTGERTHGREVGVCRLDGRDIGAAVIEAGLARDCPRFSRGRYGKLEKPAATSLPLPGYCELR
jgi:endonuclease YncB( thermonuclease family)